ncbi:hypothetical protein Phum_PHUM329300 [Pediculus humanus corporis]|uniref:Uncharacterized protein n=1 Tax=Pediculus humanus subsp. corporis TaxID=121224 RepID=E0VN66_PEDHC|nr:uncharacterized protein Phum_PHUM329300 [Pediculus humanus corporis]EEB14822.1 hypothetical protein Phum_PHUM329300 [Pediculus humanus corporis]
MYESSSVFPTASAAAGGKTGAANIRMKKKDFLEDFFYTGKGKPSTFFLLGVAKKGV